MNLNTADLREPGCLQGRCSAYSSNHEEKHFEALSTWEQKLPEESPGCPCFRQCEVLLLTESCGKVSPFMSVWDGNTSHPSLNPVRYVSDSWSKWNKWPDTCGQGMGGDLLSGWASSRDFCIYVHVCVCTSWVGFGTLFQCDCF